MSVDCKRACGSSGGDAEIYSLCGRVVLDCAIHNFDLIARRKSLQKESNKKSNLRFGHMRPNLNFLV